MAGLEQLLAQMFNRKDGPFFKSLEASLQQLHVQRQAYHGNTFVGNHVHKLLQVNYKRTLHQFTPFL